MSKMWVQRDSVKIMEISSIIGWALFIIFCDLVFGDGTLATHTFLIGLVVLAFMYQPVLGLFAAVFYYFACWS